MFNDFSEILKEFLKKLLSSRLVILAVVFVGLYAILGMRLFNLQIIYIRLRYPCMTERGKDGEKDQSYRYPWKYL